MVPCPSRGAHLVDDGLVARQHQVLVQVPQPEVVVRPVHRHADQVLRGDLDVVVPGGIVAPLLQQGTESRWGDALYGRGCVAWRRTLPVLVDCSRVFEMWASCASW
jgi:hypothetical protein